jgi:hypothetical protein
MRHTVDRFDPSAFTFQVVNTTAAVWEGCNWEMVSRPARR